MGVLDSIIGGGQKKARKKLDEGQALAEAGKAKEALACFEEAVKLDPKCADAVYARANAKLQAGKREDAVKDFNEAIRLDPGHSKAYGGRGLARVQTGRLADAVSDFNEALRLNPQSALLFYNLGSARFKQGQYQEAAEAYAQGLKLNSNHAGMWYASGKAKAALGRKDEAVADFSEAIRIEPKNPKAFGRRGTLKMSQGHLKDALSDFDKAIALAPKNAGGYFNRANVRTRLKMKEDAVADYDEAIRLSPANAMAYYNRGNGYFALGKYPEAIKDYSKALKLDSTLALAYYSRSTARIFSGERDKGIQDLEIFVQMTENSLADTSKIREESIRHLEALKTSSTVGALKMPEETVSLDALKEEESFKGKSAEGEGIKEQKFEAIVFIDICKSTNTIDNFGELHYFQKVLVALDKPLTELKKQYNCMYEKSTGDGYMLTFNDCTNAANLAICTLQSMERHNAETDDPAQKIDLRIGMDCGQVIVKETDGDRIGDAANIAKRIEGLMTDSFVELAEGAKKSFPEKNRFFASAKTLTMLGDNHAIKSSEVGWAELKGKVGVRYQIFEINWRDSRPSASPGSSSVRL